MRAYKKMFPELIARIRQLEGHFHSKRCHVDPTSCPSNASEPTTAGPSAGESANRKMFVWHGRPSFIAVAHAKSVAEARQLLLDHGELGGSGDGSCPERDKGRKIILETMPEIWRGSNAEFALTDSGELAEEEHESERLRKENAALKEQITALGEKFELERMAHAEQVERLTAQVAQWEVDHDEQTQELLQARSCADSHIDLYADALKEREKDIAQAVDAAYANAEKIAAAEVRVILGPHGDYFNLNGNRVVEAIRKAREAASAK